MKKIFNIKNISFSCFFILLISLLICLQFCDINYFFYNYNSTDILLINNENNKYFLKKYNNQINNIEISLYISRDFISDDKKNYIENISKMYEFYFSILDEYNSFNFFKSTIKDKNLNNIYIYVEKENINVKFNKNYLLDGISTENHIYINGNKKDKNILLHELFHNFDFRNNNISFSKEFINIYNKYKNNGDTIYVENIQEFFVNTCFIYINNYNNTEYRNKYLDIFNYFNKLLS